MATVIKKRVWNDQKNTGSFNLYHCVEDHSLLFLGFYLFLDILLLANFLSTFYLKTSFSLSEGFPLIVGNFYSSYTGMHDGLFSFRGVRKKVDTCCNFNLPCQ